MNTSAFAKFVILGLRRQSDVLKNFEIFNLFSSPFCHCCCISLAFIGNCWILVLLSCGEEFNGRVSLHSIFATDFFLFCRINLSNFNLSFQICSQNCVLWCQALAMSAPGCIEFDKPSTLIAKDVLVEVFVCQDNDIFFISGTWSMILVMTTTWPTSSQSLIGNLNDSRNTFLNFLSIKSTMPSAFLGPSYSVTLPSTNNLMVGNPLIYTSVFSFDPSIAAIFAMPFNALAAFSYSGARVLQWPHQGAKNYTNHIPFLTWLKSLAVTSLTAE